MYKHTSSSGEQNTVTGTEVTIKEDYRHLGQDSPVTCHRLGQNLPRTNSLLNGGPTF